MNRILLTAFLIALAPTASARSLDPVSPPVGRFSLVTYNVHGLPQAVTRLRPSESVPLIGPLLDRYDVALIQEDFAYAGALAAGDRHPYRSERAPRLELGMGDGLTFFSRLPFGELARVGWQRCNGFIDQCNDCLTRKGFARVTMTIGPGVSIVVYNLHMDAGWSAADQEARRAQVDQLLADLGRDTPIIVAGDTNMSLPRDGGTLTRLLAGAGLTDACRADGCRDLGRIDRIFYRSGAGVTLRAEGWRIDDSFVDAKGRPLSDHRAVAADIVWSTREGARALTARSAPSRRR